MTYGYYNDIKITNFNMIIEQLHDVKYWWIDDFPKVSPVQAYFNMDNIIWTIWWHHQFRNSIDRLMVVTSPAKFDVGIKVLFEISLPTFFAANFSHQHRSRQFQFLSNWWVLVLISITSIDIIPFGDYPNKLRVSRRLSGYDLEAYDLKNHLQRGDN